MNKKTYKRKTYKRKTYKRKTYRKKRGGNLALKTGQLAKNVFTNPNLTTHVKNAGIDFGQGVVNMSKRVVVDTSKGFVQKNTPQVVGALPNYFKGPTQTLPPSSLGIGYHPPLPPSPPPNNFKIAPPPTTDMSTINQ